MLDIYYLMSGSGGIDAEEITRAGCHLTSALVELEQIGYSFNLTVFRNVSDAKGRNPMIFVKVKSAGRPFDLRKMSFCVGHAAFFRCISWHWQDHLPNERWSYEYGRGRALSYDFDDETIAKGIEELTGRKCLVFSMTRIVNEGKEYIKKAIIAKGEGK